MVARCLSLWLQQIVELLLQYAVDIGLQDCNGWTPLHVAAGSGHIDVMDCLVEAGADIEWLGADDTSCLYLAAYKGYNEMVVKLLEAGAKVTAAA